MRLTKTRPYRIWTQMKSRCNDKNHCKYDIYGGKGISYDAKWETFEGFWSDMSDGYSDELTIDRIDSDKDYCKENCRWATYVEQNNNKSDNLNLEYEGSPITVNEISEITGINRSTIRSRLGSGWSVSKIINTPRLSQGQYFSKTSSKIVLLKDEDNNVISLFGSIKIASKKLPLSRYQIYDILNGRVKNNRGYNLSYKEE